MTSPEMPARRIARLLIAAALAFGAQSHVQAGSEPSPAKLAAVASVDRHARDLEDLSDRIWAYAETALREHKSAAALEDYAERQGFKVERSVAGLQTAFTATYG